MLILYTPNPIEIIKAKAPSLNLHESTRVSDSPLVSQDDWEAIQFLGNTLLWTIHKIIGRTFSAPKPIFLKGFTAEPKPPEVSELKKSPSTKAPLLCQNSCARGVAS